MHGGGDKKKRELYSLSKAAHVCIVCSEKTLSTLTAFVTTIK